VGQGRPAGFVFEVLSGFPKRLAGGQYFEERKYRSSGSGREKKDPDFVIIRLGEYKITTLFPMQLIQEHPSLKVITVRLENNSMEVYVKNTKEIKKATDLIAVLDYKKCQPPLAFAGEVI